MTFYILPREILRNIRAAALNSAAKLIESNRLRRRVSKIIDKY